jgi:hypothetical protein
LFLKKSLLSIMVSTVFQNTLKCLSTIPFLGHFYFFPGKLCCREITLQLFFSAKFTTELCHFISLQMTEET